MIAVVFPPSPAAIVMLEVVEALQAGGDLAIERRQPLGRRELQLRQRARDQQVRQEARERLLGASVRIVGQEVERAEQRSGQRRRERYARSIARPDSTPPACRRSAVASPAPTIEPLVPTSRRMPNGSTGIGSSTASTSLSVFAVAVTVADPGRAARRSASRRAARAAGERSAVGTGRRRHRRSRPVGCDRHRRGPRARAGSCAPSSAPRPRRPR